MTDGAGAAAWARAVAAADLLASAPESLGGLRLKARAGPVRDALLARLAAARRPVRRLDPTLSDAALFGGVDLGAALAARRLVRTEGLLGAPPAILILPMAERTPPAAAARLARLLAAGHAIVALDEGGDDDGAVPAGLADRLALHVDLGACSIRDLAEPAPPDPGPPVAAGDAAALLTVTAARLGIASLRAPTLALRAARAAAARVGRRGLAEADLALAAALVLGPRAACLPEPSPPPEPEPPEAEAAPPSPSTTLPDEVLVEAARATLPPGLLAPGDAARTAARGAGAGARHAATHGRPLPARRGRLGGAARLDVIETLRAAAPWQPLRRRDGAPPDRISFRRDDLRLRRFEERSERLVIFTVDASGSTAHGRLAEAKGAVELLLADSYASRDRVALVAFRGRDADILLGPTRSLARARRELACLPGGGATPLAHGLRAALLLAEGAQAGGRTASLALLTDGRPNVALDGGHDRGAAQADAEGFARRLRSRGVAGVVIDTGVRPSPQLGALAGTMGATYVVLPRAGASAISAAVGAALAPAS